jgi:3-hydroxybutyryl-CoA dehydratase
VQAVVSTAAIVPFADMKVGLAAELSWRVTVDQIDDFAKLSGDCNPLHVDANFARSQGFRDRVAHGFLLGSKVSALVGMILPGRDGLLLETLLSWPNAVYPGDDVLLRGVIVELSEEQRVVRIKIRATKVDVAQAIVVGRGWALCRIRS